MASLFIIFICLVIGLFLQRQKSLPANSHVALNMVILHASLPAVCLLTVPGIEWEPKLLAVATVAWLIFGFSYLVFTTLGNRLGWSRNVQGCLIITAGLCNSAFVGFPVIETLFGQEGLRYAVLFDQPGSFVIVSTWALVVGARFSESHMRKRDLLRKVLFFPPFMAFALALILGLSGWQAQGLTQEILKKIAGTLTPLAMISVGLQLQWRNVRDDMKYLASGLVFKLFLAPALVFIVYMWVGLPTQVFKVVVLESAMAPMITGGIVATSYNLHPRLSGLMIGVGVPLSFLTLAAWYFLL